MVKKGITHWQLVFERGIEVDKEKVGVVQKLTSHTSLKEVTIFLGHVRFYCLFNKEFLNIPKLLTKFLLKDAKFIFDELYLESF